MKAKARRLLLEVIGWLLVVAGIAALVLPGPGLLMIFAGLVLLSQEYDWAERRLEPVKKRALKAAAESVETWPRIMVTAGMSVGLIALGVLWSWEPPAPDWWPVHEKWWLAGGWGTGITQIASGLIALALLVYSYRRFREKSSSADTAS